MVTIKFSPINEEYIRDNTYGVVRRAPGSKSKDSIQSLDEELIRSHSSYTGAEGEDTRSTVTLLNDNVRRYIPLPLPILNRNLAGSQLTYIKNITQLKDLDALIKFESVLDITNNTVVPRDSTIDQYVMPTLSESRYKIGPDAVLYLLDIIDMNQVIENYCLKLAKLAIGKAKMRVTKDVDVIGEIDRTGDIVIVTGKYHFSPHPLFADKLKQEHMDSVLREEYQKMESSLALMLNVRPDLQVLKDMFLDKLIVTPNGMHPVIDGRMDSFMSGYSDLLDKTNILTNVLDSKDIRLQDVVSHYITIQNAVDKLIFKSSVREPNKFSFAEKIKGKTGLIRGKMLGKRVDFSGRSIITINPELSIDYCALPTYIIANIYRYHHIKATIGTNTISDILNMSHEEAARQIEQLGILDRVPAMLNRAPSLHKLSFMGFLVKISTTNAIEINPLVTTGFNADFDGDAMGVHAPLSDEAIHECLELMLPSKNIRHPANGKPILVPRMEMVYGLNVASKVYSDSKPSKSYTYNNLKEVYSDVLTHKIKVYDKVTVNGYTTTAGRQALYHVLPDFFHGRDITVNSKTIKDITDEVLSYGDTELYRNTVDGLVDYGFKISKLYTPSIDILGDYSHDMINDPLKGFYSDMANVFNLYQVGLEDEDRYLEVFTERLHATSKDVEANLAEILGEDNGFLQLVLSGARGSLDNLKQIYSFRGQIKRSDYEDFPAVIDRGLAEQLHPLQHFISAYGTRKGLTDKTQKTADTGYLGRLMYQAASDYVITNTDCGTSKGLRIYRSMLLNFIKDEDEGKRNENVNSVYQKLITNRVSVATGKFITAEEAYDLVITQGKSYVEIFSPLYCESPCCQKCYGEETGTGRYPRIGTAIGYIAGQAIGEPGTQLTMRTFQKGGVAGKKDVTSNFDRIKKFIYLSPFDEMNTYDPIAWTDGEIRVVNEDIHTKTIRIGEDSRDIKVNADAELKKEVIKGQGICLIPGDHTISEMLKYSTFEVTQRYVLMAMYMCYMDQAEIDLCHFEVLVASMSLYGVYDDPTGHFKPGCIYTAQRYWEEVRKGAAPRIYRTLRSVKELPLLKDSPLSNIVLENIGKGLARAAIFEYEDRLDTNMGLMLIGKRPKLGTNLSRSFIDGV